MPSIQEDIKRLEEAQKQLAAAEETIKKAKEEIDNSRQAIIDQQIADFEEIAEASLKDQFTEEGRNRVKAFFSEKFDEVLLIQTAKASGNDTGKKDIKQKESSLLIQAALLLDKKEHSAQKSDTPTSYLSLLALAEPLINSLATPVGSSDNRSNGTSWTDMAYKGGTAIFQALINEYHASGQASDGKQSQLSNAEKITQQRAQSGARSPV